MCEVYVCGVCVYGVYMCMVYAHIFVQVYMHMEAQTGSQISAATLYLTPLKRCLSRNLELMVNFLFLCLFLVKLAASNLQLPSNPPVSIPLFWGDSHP